MRVNQDGLSLLSSRERQVLELAAAGLIDKEIGSQLGVTINTLRTYWSRIRAKVGDFPRAAIASAFTERAVVEIRTQELDAGISPENWEEDVETEMIFASDSINDIHGLRRGLAHPFTRYLANYHPDDLAGLAAARRAAINGKGTLYTFTYRIIAEGTMQVITALAHIVRDSDGKAVKAFFQRVHAVDCRPQQEPVVKLGFWNLDLERLSFEAEPACCRILGLGLDLCTSPEVFFRATLGHTQAALIERLVEAEREGLDGFCQDHRLVTPDGRGRWARLDARLERGLAGIRRIYGSIMVFE